MTESFAIGRVVAALDAASHDLALVPAAVEIAARLKAQTVGLFIEDENLLRLCASPAARHVTLGPSIREVPSVDQIQAEFRALAAQAQAALATAAAQHGVPWSFHVVRGRPQVELHERIQTADLIVVGHARSLAGLPLRLASALHDAAHDLPYSTLHLQRQSGLARPIVIVRADTRLGERTLAAALQVAGPQSRKLDVLLVGDAAKAARLQQELTTRLADSGISARVGPLAAADIDELIRALAATRGDILIAAADIPLFHGRDAVARVLERTGLPVMIIRG